MEKYLFEKEYEMRASIRILYPFINTSDGLAKWFADKAVQISNTEYNFIWENTDHYARLISSKINKFSRFEFPNLESVPNGVKCDYIEFRLETNEMTNSVFLKINDFSANQDFQELENLWDGLVNSLKEITGG